MLIFGPIVTFLKKVGIVLTDIFVKTYMSRDKTAK